jgi:hypothetical protein
MIFGFFVKRALRASYRHNGLSDFNRLRGRGTRRLGAEDGLELIPRFDEQAWEEGVNDVLSWALDQAGNAGQETLITDYLAPKVLDYCEYTQEEYNPEEFVRVMQDELGDTYYYAINEIIDEMALMIDELRDAVHQSFLENAAFALGNPFGYAALYASTRNRQYANNAAALLNYDAAAIRNGYRSATSSAGRKYNRELNRQKLIKQFGSGRTRAWKSASGMENNPGYASYKAAAARNGKIINP